MGFPYQYAHQFGYRDASKLYGDTDVDQSLFDLKNVQYNVRDFGARANGTTDDTAAIQACYDQAASTGGWVLFPRGTYGVTATINMHGQTPASALPVATLFAGTENLARIKALSDIAGPILNCSPTTGSASASWRFENVYIDAQLAPSSSGIYVNNVQLLVMNGCKLRGGDSGIRIGAVSAGWFQNCVVYNCATAGYYYEAGTTTNSQGHSWVGCYYFMSTGATADQNAGWLDLSGHQDQTYVNCRVTRAPGINFALPYGWKLDGPGTTVGNAASVGAGASWFINCVADSIVDGNNPGTGSTGASYWFSEQANIRMSQCWASALDTAKTFRQPCVYANNVFRFMVENSYMSGTGIRIAGTNDYLQIRDNHFPNPNTADACIGVSGATITNLLVQGNTKEKSAAAWFDDATVAQTAQIPLGNVL